MKKQTKIIAICLLATAFALAFYAAPRVAKHLEIMRIESQNQAVQEQLANEMPDQKYLDVQFICQAPLETEENWTLHEESCEEAALLQAYNYETNQTTTKPEANEKILDMIAWQEEHLGSHKDLYEDDMREFATGYLGISDEELQTFKNSSIHDIKKQIDAGHPVIVPVTSQFLENPHYPHPGYHMLVVTGYTSTHLITNDNGTRHGEDFAYEYGKFDAAMQDAGGVIFILNLKKD